MLRLFAAAIAALMMLVVPALAGDRAIFNFLGYSQDLKYAAFEEFGEYDGAGGVYSTIYIVNLADDSWVTGSPYTLDAGGDGADTPPISEIRMKVRSLAEAKLKELKIDVPAETLYLLGDGMGNDKGYQVTFSTPNCCGPGQTQDDSFSLVLGLTGVKSTECPDDMYSLVGFTLALFDETGKHMLHEDDKTIPKSRGCTLDYRIYAVLAPFEEFGPRIAVIETYPTGFEGPDRRFMLVPIDGV